MTWQMSLWMAGYDWDGLTNAAVNQLRLSRLRRMEPITEGREENSSGWQSVQMGIMHLLLLSRVWWNTYRYVLRTEINPHQSTQWGLPRTNIVTIMAAMQSRWISVKAFDNGSPGIKECINSTDRVRETGWEVEVKYWEKMGRKCSRCQKCQPDKFLPEPRQLRTSQMRRVRQRRESGCCWKVTRKSNMQSGCCCQYSTPKYKHGKEKAGVHR